MPSGENAHKGVKGFQPTVGSGATDVPETQNRPATMKPKSAASATKPEENSVDRSWSQFQGSEVQSASAKKGSSMMTFHESYGELPESTLRLIKRSNVSPMDYEMLLDKFGRVDTHFPDVEAFIKEHTVDKSYRPPLYM